MRILVKLGGTLLESAESRRRLAREIGAACGPSLEVAVVHGGGKQLTAFLAERGVESRFVNGLRVTSAEVLDSVVKVVAGSVNRSLTASFIAENVAAVGLCGIDGLLTEAEPLDPALGFVGRPVRSHPALLEALTAAGFLPVIACLAGDRAGNLYNVNADQMAVSVAQAFGAQKLLFFTDVEGVLDAGRNLCPVLDPAACRSLIGTGAATGGMRAKLDAALSALSLGIPEVVIAPGARPGLLADLVAGRPAGTRIVP